MTALKKVTVTDSVQSPGKSACGLAWDGQTFWYYDLAVHNLFQVTLSGEVLQKIHIETACCDTTFDGKYIWQASPSTLQIFILDPENGDVVKTLDTPDKCSGLCCSGPNFVRGSWTRKEIIYFDEENGEEIRSIKTGASTAGIAFDGSCFWHGGEIDGVSYLFKVNPKTEKHEKFVLDFTISGLTFDGESLWAADGTNNRFVKLEIV